MRLYFANVLTAVYFLYELALYAALLARAPRGSGWSAGQQLVGLRWTRTGP